MRLFLRAALLAWIAPFCAALSNATVASRTACSADSRSSPSMRRRAWRIWFRALVRNGALRTRLRKETRADLALGNLFVTPEFRGQCILTDVGMSFARGPRTSYCTMLEDFSGTGPSYVLDTLDSFQPDEEST